MDLSSLTKQIVPFTIEGLLLVAVDAFATKACFTLSAMMHRPPSNINYQEALFRCFLYQ